MISSPCPSSRGLMTLRFAATLRVCRLDTASNPSRTKSWTAARSFRARPTPTAVRGRRRRSTQAGYMLRLSAGTIIGRVSSRHTTDRRGERRHFRRPLGSTRRKPSRTPSPRRVSTRHTGQVDGPNVWKRSPPTTNPRRADGNRNPGTVHRASSQPAHVPATTHLPVCRVDTRSPRQTTVCQLDTQLNPQKEKARRSGLPSTSTASRPNQPGFTLNS